MVGILLQRSGVKVSDAAAPGLRDPTRLRALRRGVALEVVTVAWNVIECLVAVISGVAAGSVVLLGYGFDSLIETGSAAVVGLRLRSELRGLSPTSVRNAERRAARIAGALLFLLAATITVESIRRLLGSGAHPDESPAGIVLTTVAALAMPLLGRSKLRLARRLASHALRIEAEQTFACAWFSLTTLAGLLLNAAFGWWWADPLAALVLVPWMAREGLEPWSSPERLPRP
jgi:divalent metal cation (Fe/Co/Zn/Cd) transporter